MLHFYLQITDKINELIEWLLALLMLTLLIVVFLQVLFRYAILSPLSWSEETSRYLMIWTVYLGASVAIKRQSHVGFTAMVARLPQRARTWSMFVARCLIFYALVTLVDKGLNAALFNRTQMSPGLGISMMLPYLAVPIGSALCIIQLVPLMFNLSLEPKQVKPPSVGR